MASFLTGWTEKENREAVIKCFNSWLSVFGTRIKEESNIINQFNDWLLTAQHTDFIEVHAGYKKGKRPSSIKSSGYKMLVSPDNPKEHFLVYTGAFKARNVVLKALADARMLDQNLEKNREPYQKKISKKLEENRPYCYVVYHLETDDENEE